jgi:hypothetical protein
VPLKSSFLARFVPFSEPSARRIGCAFSQENTASAKRHNFLFFQTIENQYLKIELPEKPLKTGGR